MLQLDILVAEIGSTTTVVNAFTDLATQTPRFLGQGVAPTSVLEGDVTLGLKRAISDLEISLGSKVVWKEMLATSSAAGGLRMTVHGLVHDMTVRAAQEAALGAGAILKMITSGPLSEADLEQIRDTKPNIILLAGGVEHGERATAILNARRLASLRPQAPIIYAGNSAAAGEVAAIFCEGNVRHYVVENVYPKIDELNVEPTRRVIQQVFEEHIVHGPGMERIRELVTGPIMPTPGAVMEAAKLLQAEIGDLVVVDVGGATTDVHSVTPGSEEIARLMISPEPVAKRTVEGDLGVYINATNVAERIGIDRLSQHLQIDAAQLLATWAPIPQHVPAERLLRELTKEAVKTALTRHVGSLKYLYGPSGRITIAEGKDLSSTSFIIGTGGPLTRLSGAKELLLEIFNQPRGFLLLPKKVPEVLIDQQYNLAVLGVLSSRYRSSALQLIRQSLGLT